MDWWKKHADTAVVIGSVLAAVMWMNASINDVRNELHTGLSEVKTELAVIKTVLVMKQIMPCELAKTEPSALEK